MGTLPSESEIVLVNVLRRLRVRGADGDDTRQEFLLAYLDAINGGADLLAANRTGASAAYRFARSLRSRQSRECLLDRDHPRSERSVASVETLAGLPNWAIRFGSLVLEGYSQAECAYIMGVSLPALKQRLLKLRNKGPAWHKAAA